MLRTLSVRLLLIALLTALGLVGNPSASWAGCTGYEPCTSTKSDVSAPKSVKQGASVTVKVKVDVNGDLEPSGVVTVVVKGPGGFKKTIKVEVVKGKAVNVDLGKLKRPGKYKVTTKFKGDDGYRNSTATTTITVKKKKD